jgi:lipopolysaccharide heptosyltransferase II
MTQVRRILLIRLSSVGDVVLATAVLGGLRRQYPEAHIAWLVDRGYQDLLTRQPVLDQVFVFDAKGRHRGALGRKRLATEMGSVDLLIDLQNKARPLLLGRLLQPQKKIVWVKRRGWDLLRTLFGRGRILSAPHQVQRYLDLLGVAEKERSSQPTIFADPKRVAGFLAIKQSRTLVGIVPSARHETKTWPKEHLLVLAQACQEAGHELVFLSGPKDDARVFELGRSLPRKPILALAEGGLDELTALIASCDVVVSPDSGPAHMAAALNVPLVVLFGPTDPLRWAPLGKRVRVLSLNLKCSPCSNYGGPKCPEGSHSCLRQIHPHQVMEAIKEWL